MINLFPDQQELITQLRSALSRRKSVLMQAATGSGKTVMAASIIHGSRAKGTRCLMTVPRLELLAQSRETFEEYDIPFGFVASGYDYNPYCRSYLATSGTLANRIKKNKAPDIDVLIVDETHYGGEGLNGIIAHYRKKGAWIIGLSATPWRLDGTGLGMWYEEMVCGPSMRWLIDNKRLSDYRPFAPSQADLSQIRIVGGDYAKGQLAERMEQDRVLVGSAVSHYRQHAMGRLNIAYTTSRRHSEIVAQSFRDAGIPAAAIDGETPPDERKRIIRAFARRELLTLVNCELLTFGFDLAAAAGMDVTVESMSDLRPTKSLSLQMQKWGRTLRRKDYPALIFDHSGNFNEHGLPDDDRSWSLNDRAAEERSGSKERAIPVMRCDNCAFSHRPAPACPNCGQVYEAKGRLIDEVEGELLEMSADELRGNREQKQKQDLYKLIAIAKKRGYASPEAWAAKMLTQEAARRRAG